VLKNPEERIGIYSYAQIPAQRFLRRIKRVLEDNEILKELYPDVLWKNPRKESPLWREDLGIIVKRQGDYLEPTVSAYGLTEGMPTGSHFTKRVYDDIVTEDIASSFDVMEKVKRRFDVSAYTGTKDGRVRIVGTYYHHDDPLVYIRNKVDQDTGKPLFTLRFHPGTENGSPNGKPVLLPKKRLNELKIDKRAFRTQILLDPTPREDVRLNYNCIPIVPHTKIPEKLWKFMTIDPASDKAGQDSWAILCVGVWPFMDDLGASTVYILDAVIEPMDLIRAVNTVVDMYMRNGKILRIGVEKTGATTTEIHVKNALAARGKFVSVDSGTLALLKPRGRKKEFRIESALAWPISNGKIRISESVPKHVVERLFTEMEKFPYWHDDGLDALAYVYDLIADYNFPKFVQHQTETYETVWDRAFKYVPEHRTKKHSWMWV